MALILEVSTQGTNVAQYIQLSTPAQTPHSGHTYTLYPKLVCTCLFPIMLGMPFRNFWRLLRNNPFSPFHLGLVYLQYLLEGPPMHEEYDPMSGNVVGKLCHNPEGVGPCPVGGPSVEGIVQDGKGDAALLLRQGEVQSIRSPCVG